MTENLCFELTLKTVTQWKKSTMMHQQSTNKINNGEISHRRHIALKHAMAQWTCQRWTEFIKTPWLTNPNIRAQPHMIPKTLDSFNF